MTANTLELNDTFGQWREKINDMVGIINQQSIDIADLEAAFNAPTPFGISSVSGLTANLIGGRVRDGSVVETLTNAALALTANDINVICIYKKTGEPAEFQVHLLSELPTEHIIPLHSVTTNATSVTASADLRTQYNTASGSAGSASSVLQFDKLIENDVIVPEDRNALSIDPVVGAGVTVTVSPNSVWVVL